jgi:hypothetical protein
VVDSCEQSKNHSSFIRGRGMALLSEGLYASQKGLCSEKSASETVADTFC